MASDQPMNGAGEMPAPEPIFAIGIDPTTGAPVVMTRAPARELLHILARVVEDLRVQAAVDAMQRAKRGVQVVDRVPLDLLKKG